MCPTYRPLLFAACAAIKKPPFHSLDFLTTSAAFFRRFIVASRLPVRKIFRILQSLNWGCGHSTRLQKFQALPPLFLLRFLFFCTDGATAFLAGNKFAAPPPFFIGVFISQHFSTFFLSLKIGYFHLKRSARRCSGLFLIIGKHAAAVNARRLCGTVLTVLTVLTFFSTFKKVRFNRAALAL